MDDSKQDSLSWAENDRKAGHLKMQVMRIFSGLDSAVEGLRHNPSALMQAHHIFLADAAAKGVIPDELNHASGFTSAFGASYRAYQKCKPNIERLIHKSNLDLSEDNDEAHSSAIEKIMREGEATFCIEIGRLWLSNSEAVDPVDR